MVALVSSARRLQRSRAGTGEQQCAMRAGKAPVSFIFVSHHSRDDAAACTLRDWLQKEGHAAVFLDHDTEAGIAGGEPWEERLYTELRRCRALIALVGPAPVLRRGQSIDLDQSEEAQERLRRGLLTAALDPRSSFVLRDDRPPYPGLATFQREDAAVYFGREQEITDLLALLLRQFHQTNSLAICILQVRLAPRTVFVTLLDSPAEVTRRWLPAPASPSAASRNQTR